ncbi:MAG TPA: flavodoxin domain-containing protein [Candidatus Bathyarchaeia archaeon]|jgi:flavorubredoxin|nr:flavodoxin domain-containing protein [Candidatus Bathyarchaeia archaeon]
MSKALIVYHTEFGNTEKIAKAMAEGIRTQGVDVDCLKTNEANASKIGEYDLLALGGPTHAFGISKPVKDFLKQLENTNLSGKKAFAFDTKMKSRLAGSAAKGIEKKLQKLGMTIVTPHASAIVKGREGPLEEGTEEAFKQVGVSLAKSLQ